MRPGTRRPRTPVPVTSNSGLTLTRARDRAAASETPLDEEAFIVAGYAPRRCRLQSLITPIKRNPRNRRANRTPSPTTTHATEMTAAAMGRDVDRLRKLVTTLGRVAR